MTWYNLVALVAEFLKVLLKSQLFQDFKQWLKQKGKPSTTTKPSTASS